MQAIDPLLQRTSLRPPPDHATSAGWPGGPHAGDAATEPQPGSADDNGQHDAEATPPVVRRSRSAPNDDVGEGVVHSELAVAEQRSAPNDGDLGELELDDRADFGAFYSDARSSVGRALALTLRNADLAADCVDEALVRAYQKWDVVSRLDNPAGWVYRVGINHARSRIRRLLRRPPARPAIYHELHVRDPAIERALAGLPVDQRAVVVCRHLLGWSEAQTADALRIRPGTVKSRLSRALTRLEVELRHLRPEDQS